MKKVNEGLFFDYFSDHYLKSVQIRISDGCLEDCSFCAIPGNEGREVHFTPRAELKAEFLRFWEQGINHLEFLDDTFLLDGEEVGKLLQELSEEGIGFAFSFATPVKTLLRNQKYLMPLKKLGLRSVVLGFINSNEDVLKRYGLKFTPADQLYAIQLLQALRVQIQLKYILFDPLTTLGHLSNDFTVLEKNKLLGLYPFTDILASYFDMESKSRLNAEYSAQGLYQPPADLYTPYQLKDKGAGNVLYWMSFFEIEYGSRWSFIHQMLLELRSELARKKSNWMVTNPGQELMYITLSLRMMPYELFKALLDCAVEGKMQIVTESEMRQQCNQTFVEIEEKYWDYRKTYNI